MRDLIEQILAMNANRLEALKSIPQPKLGWTSISTPEEVISAAGIVPFRMTGDDQTSTSEAGALLHHNMCSYVLTCLAEGLEGAYEFTEGLVMVDACNARRRLFDVWNHFVKPRHSYLIDLPKEITPLSKQYFRSQVRAFARSLESHFNCQITERGLSEAIRLSNQTRQLLTRLYEHRKTDAPPITGNEAMGIVKASMTGRRAEFNDKLAQLLAALEFQPGDDTSKKHRVLICGSYFDLSNIVDVIERFGAIVVCEDISNGIKYFEGQIDPTADPLEAIADYYADKATCSRMIDSDVRIAHLFRLVEEYRAESVIYFSLKFCDNNLMDFPYVRDRLADRDIPSLFVEGEQQMTNIENVKTRIQTFLETRI